MHCYPPTPPWPWYLELHDSCQNSWFSLKNFSQNIPLLAYKPQVFLQVPKNQRNQTIKLFLLRALLFGYIVSFVVRNLCLSTYRKNHCLWVTKYIQIVASSHLKMDYFFCHLLNTWKRLKMTSVFDTSTKPTLKILSTLDISNLPLQMLNLVHKILLLSSF